MMGRNYSYLAVEKTSAGVRIVRVICRDAPKGAAEKEVVVELKSQLVYLRVSVFGEAICNFSFSTDGRRFQSVGDIFVAEPGMWIGAKLGLFALAPAGATTQGYADYNWFRFRFPTMTTEATIPTRAPIPPPVIMYLNRV